MTHGFKMFAAYMDVIYFFLCIYMCNVTVNKESSSTGFCILNALSSRYACSKTGHVFEIDLQKVTIKHVRRLLPNENKAGKDKQKGQIQCVQYMY